VAKRHSSQPLPTFPPEINREAFGHYLAGLVDGEGCFVLRTNTRNGARGKSVVCWAAFNIALRADDYEILELTRSFLQCGHVYYCPRKRNRENEKPTMVFSVTRNRELLSKVVQHFDRFPLRAKKAKAYDIWKEGAVFLMARNDGAPKKWSPEEFACFDAIRERLENQRAFPFTMPHGIEYRPRRIL
jgi:hypothetical protein